jgi:hypothetical protein
MVGDRPFPSLDLSPESIGNTFSRFATDLSATTIGIVERHIRSGYCGLVNTAGWQYCGASRAPRFRIGCADRAVAPRQ